MNGWKKAGRGARVKLVATLEEQESTVLRGLVGEVVQMLDGREASSPADELADAGG